MGVSLLFSEELRGDRYSAERVTGILYALLGTYMVSIGNMISARFSRKMYRYWYQPVLGLVMVPFCVGS